MAEQRLAEIRTRQRRVWPAQMPREIPEGLKGRTLTECVADQARDFPDRPAIRFYGTDITYAQLDDWSARFAGWLQRSGVQPGDRVGLFTPNCPQFIVLMLGTLKAGAVHVPINPMFKRHELEYEANDAGLRVIVAAGELMNVVREAELPAGLAAVQINLRDLVPADPALPLPKVLQPEETRLAEGHWAELISGAPAQPHPQASGALAALNYTGGTTGMPKGCMHSQGNMVVAGSNCAMAWGILHPGDETPETVLAYNPVFWISGENTGILAPLLAGASIVLLTRWDAAAALAAIEQYRVTAMSGVVESYLELLEASRDATAQLGSLRHLRAMSFSRRLTIDIRRQWEKATGGGSVLREGGFGMTESHTSNSFTTGLEGDDFDLHSEPVFCGLPMPGTDFLILDRATRLPASLGETGEIAVRTPAAFTGYWRAPDATASVFHHGWLLTGDTGKLSVDGCLHYLGRQKEMIKVNGMSVFPSEVEVLMARHPAIESVAVVGVPHAHKGQEVIAYVQLRPGEEPREEELQEWAKGQMSTYKVPRVLIITNMPMTATGKIRKTGLPMDTPAASSSEAK